MGGTGLNLKGVKDVKSAESGNDSAGEMTYSSVSPMDALMHVVVRPPTLDNNTGPNNNLTAQSNTPSSALHLLNGLKPADQLNPNGSTLVNGAMTAEKETTKIAAVIDKAKQLNVPDPKATVAATMTPVAPAPSIQPPTIGGGSYTASNKKDRKSDYSVWMPSTSPDPVMAAANFSAQNQPVIDTRIGGRLQTPLNTPDNGRVALAGQSLDGMKINDLATKMQGQNMRVGQAAADILFKAGLRETNGAPRVAFNPPTPVKQAPTAAV